MNKTFFTIITINSGIDKHVSKRVVGCFENFLLARTCVLGNFGDIYENGYYEHAIIEELPFGLYPIPQQQLYYRWDVAKGGYVSKQLPEYLKGRLFFG